MAAVEEIEEYEEYEEYEEEIIEEVSTTLALWTELRNNLFKHRIVLFISNILFP